MKKAYLLILSALLSLQVSCSSKAMEEHTTEIFAMSTIISISAWGEDAKEVVRRGEEFIYSMEEKFSTTRATSEISLINDAPEQWHDICTEVEEVLLYAQGVSERTSGAFDPTVYPLVAAWGFTQNQNRVPPEEEIQELLPLVNASAMAFEEGQVRLEEGMMLDLGGIAKGYITDCLAEQFREDGITSAMVSLGGNVYVLGTKTDGSLWNIGIQNPYGGGAIGSLQARDKAVITSGGYQRYFTDSETGETYCHIIDPRTGYPSDSGIASVTVICDSGMRGDALSTAFFVMGLEESIAYWREYDNFDLVLISSEGDVYITPGISSSFSLMKTYTQGSLQVIS